MKFTDNSHFIELVKDFHANPSSFAFFVGAGLSQPLFPSWATLLTEMLRSCEDGLAYEVDELMSYVEAGEQYLEVADACVQALGPAKYRGLLEKIFDKEFEDSEIPNAYRELFKLNPKLIFTTNYDRIPERLSSGQQRTFTNLTASEAMRAKSDSKSIIFKVHGDITNNKSLILGTSDYQNIINKNVSTQNFIKSCFSGTKFIFIGFSLVDPHITFLLDNLNAMNDGLPISHYVLLNESSRFKANSFSNKYGLKVIPYTSQDGTHSEVSDFIRALQNSPSNSSTISAPVTTVEPTNNEELLSALTEIFNEKFVNSTYTIAISERKLCLGFNTNGETASEIQRELLVIIKSFKFKCDFIDNININLYIDFSGSNALHEIQPIITSAHLALEDAFLYATKVISAPLLWKKMKFSKPREPANLFSVREDLVIPLNPSLIEF